MEYARIEGLKLPVSRLVFGTAFAPMNQGKPADEILDAVFAAGINTFDTAAVYGDSEAALGDWIRRRGLEEEVNVLTKGCHPTSWRERVTPYDLMSDLSTSFAKLGRKRVELYLLHRDDPTQPVGPIVELLHSLKEQGRIGAYGGSNWTAARIREANEYAREKRLTSFTLSSPQYSLAVTVRDPWGWRCVTLTGEAMAEEREWYVSTQTPVFAYSSLASGFFSGRFRPDEPEKAREILGPFASKAFHDPINFRRLARAEELAGNLGMTANQVALAYTLASPMNVFPIFSTRRREALEENIEVLERKLTPEQIAFLEG